MEGYPCTTVGSVPGILQCYTTPIFSLFFFWIPFSNPVLRPETAGFFQVNSLISEKKADSDTSKFLLGSIFKYPNDAEQKKIALPFHPNEPAFQCSPDLYPKVWDWEPLSILALEYTLEGCARGGWMSSACALSRSGRSQVPWKKTTVTLPQHLSLSL